MHEACVCGGNPPEHPNDDCERCQMVCEIERLRVEVSDLKNTLPQFAATCSKCGTAYQTQHWDIGEVCLACALTEVVIDREKLRALLKRVRNGVTWSFGSGELLTEVTKEMESWE